MKSAGLMLVSARLDFMLALPVCCITADLLQMCTCRYVPEMPVFTRYDAAYYEFMRIFDAFKVRTGS